MTPPTGPTSWVPPLLLSARIVMAIATVSLCVVLVVHAIAMSTAGSPAPNTIDAVVGVIATVALVIGGALLLLAQIIAGHQAGAARRVGNPAAVSAWLGVRTRRPAVLAASAILIVIVVSATMPQPRSLADAAALFGLGAVSLVLDTVSTGWAYRHGRRYTPPPQPPDPGGGRRVVAELAQSATISRVFGSLLLIALAVTIVDQAVRTPPQPAAALQIGTSALAALIPFVLAGALRALSRCVEGDSVDATALRRAAAHLWLVVGAATVVAAVTFVAVLRTDFADDQVPMYRAVAIVLVLLVAVLNCAGLSRLQHNDVPVRDSPKVPYRH